MNKPVVTVENLTKQYKGKAETAVSHISFTMQPGEILALIGPNGAGKTTTIKMLLGLVAPSAGTAGIAGFDMSVEKERRQGVRHVGAVLEGARNAYWRLSARANLHYFGTLRGLRGKRLQQRIEELLRLLRLEAEAEREVRHFSRGMQQKVAIAAALLHDPDVLLLDEPTLGLDVQAAKSLEQTIVTLAAQGKAVLLTTHQLGLAQRLSHTTFIIRNGRQIAYDRTQALLHRFQTQTIVEVKLQDTLSAAIYQAAQAHFPQMTLLSQNGTSTLTWPDAAQADVGHLFNYLDQRGQTILSIQRRETTLEELFLSLIENTSHDAILSSHSG